MITFIKGVGEPKSNEKLFWELGGLGKAKSVLGGGEGQSYLVTKK